ncbi:MAG TPA: GH92 family glycosyl hydrolase [Chitinophaga sp.]
MKLRLTILIFLLGAGMLQAQPKWRLSYVQPLTGTANSTTTAALKHGEGTERLANTIPAVGTPFAMTQWTPQTRTTEQKCLAPYYYKDEKLSGFRGTHWLSGSCTQDYGSVTIMPITGSLRTQPADFAAPYSHEQETAAPDYYRVQLDRYGITAEMTALARSSLLQFTVQRADSFYLLVMPNSDQQQGHVEIDTALREISAYNPVHRIYQGWGQPAGFSGYFVIQVERPFTVKGTFNNGAYIGFKARAGERVRIRVGTSFTSIAAARSNLQAEIHSWDLATLRARCAFTWERALRQIQVQGQDEAQQRIFYTALYHSLQHPRLFNDVDGTYPQFAHQYEQDQLKEGNYYDDFSMWDIYRAQLPLLEILFPDKVNDMAASLVRKGQQGGWLPIFPCWNSYTCAMVGDHSIAFIASAWLKGINRYDGNAAYTLMRRNAFETPSRAEYLDGKGRRALTSYLQYGYVPLEDSVPDAFHKREQVSRTLEYAYDDYALAMMAKALGKEEDYTLLMQRAQNYRQVFDTATGFMRGRYANGNWYTPFYPDQKMPFITEGTPRQYTFYVPQDIPGLAALMGGTPRLEAALDSLFEKGEYWHGNEPGHQIPFLYNYTSSPWKTQREVRRILETEYADGPGGLSGNDDAGQMSAWYVFAAMGFYPVDPVSGNYALCRPLFDSIVLQLPGNRETVITVHKQNPQAAYIDKVLWNDVRLGSLFVTHQQLARGGRLDIWLK